MFGRLLTALVVAFATLLAKPAAWAQVVSINLTGVLTSPAACEGALYFGADDGKLYAINAADGSTVLGFPVDVGAAVGDDSFPDGRGRSGGRPGVYYGAHGKAIYIETSKHGVVKVWPNGTVAWVNKLDATSPIGGSDTPAVTPNGEVIAEMKTATNVHVVKLRETDGTLLSTSPPLATLYFDFISSPAVIGNEIYVTVSPYPVAGLHNRVTVLNLNDLSVRASIFGSGTDYSPPYVREGSVYFGSDATDGATVFKLNATTLNPDARFGAGSHTDPGVTRVLPFGQYGVSEVCASPTSADRDPDGTIYVSVSVSNLARVVAIDAVSGEVRVLHSTGGLGSAGLVVSPKGVIAYGDGKTLKMISVDGGVLKSYPLPSYPFRPCYDPTTNRFFVTTIPDATGTSYLLGFDSP